MEVKISLFKSVSDTKVEDAAFIFLARWAYWIWTPDLGGLVHSRQSLTEEAFPRGRAARQRITIWGSGGKFMLLVDMFAPLERKEDKTSSAFPVTLLNLPVG